MSRLIFRQSSVSKDSSSRANGLRWRLALLLLPSLWWNVPVVRAAVQYSPERKVWVLQAGETTYAMGVNERGELQSIYWGPRVTRDADFSAAHSRAEIASFDLSS